MRHEDFTAIIANDSVSGHSSAISYSVVAHHQNWLIRSSLRFIIYLNYRVHQIHSVYCSIEIYIQLEQDNIEHPTRCLAHSGRF